MNTERNSGIYFGKAATKSWLAALRVNHLVRSHECMEKGYEQLRLGNGKAIHTVFSASNYSGGHNLGAVLIFEENAGMNGGAPRVSSWKSTLKHGSELVSHDT